MRITRATLSRGSAATCSFVVVAPPYQTLPCPCPDVPGSRGWIDRWTKRMRAIGVRPAGLYIPQGMRTIRTQGLRGEKADVTAPAEMTGMMTASRAGLWSPVGPGDIGGCVREERVSAGVQSQGAPVNQD